MHRPLLGNVKWGGGFIWKSLIVPSACHRGLDRSLSLSTPLNGMVILVAYTSPLNFRRPPSRHIQHHQMVVVPISPIRFDTILRNRTSTSLASRPSIHHQRFSVRRTLSLSSCFYWTLYPFSVAPSRRQEHQFDTTRASPPNCQMFLSTVGPGRRLTTGVG